MILDPKRTVAELKELRALTADENGAQRVAWTDTWLKAREWFASKLKGLPVEQHCDAAGNGWVTLPGASEKALLLGGHLDSVPNAGWTALWTKWPRSKCCGDSRVSSTAGLP